MAKDKVVNIFQLLTKAKENEVAVSRKELLKDLNVIDFFAGGSISIDKRTCQGVECKLCIEVCPTNTLFWKAGEVGIVDELCVYCGACVVACIVDDCIKVSRKRSTCEVEVFSKPRDFTVLQQCINGKKRFERVMAIFPKPENYLKRYGKME